MSGDLVVGDEAIPDVADGPDQALVVAAELGPQTTDVDVDRAGAAEVVVAPHLLQQLLAGEDPARMLGRNFSSSNSLNVRSSARPRSRAV